MATPYALAPHACCLLLLVNIIHVAAARYAAYYLMLMPRYILCFLLQPRDYYATLRLRYAFEMIAIGI